MALTILIRNCGVMDLDSGIIEALISESIKLRLRDYLRKKRGLNR